MAATLQTLLKALSEPRRAEMLEALARADHSVEDLARLTGLGEATASRHLSKLRAAGLVGQRRAGRHRDHYLRPAALDPLLTWLGELRQSRDRPEYAAASYREDVLQRFMEDESGRLPRHPRKRELVLDWLAQLLEDGRFYRREELMRLWGPWVRDWEALVDEMERRGRISGNGTTYIGAP